MLSAFTFVSLFLSTSFPQVIFVEHTRCSAMAILQSLLEHNLQSLTATESGLESIFLSIHNLRSVDPIMLGVYFADSDGIPLSGEIVGDRLQSFQPPATPASEKQRSADQSSEEQISADQSCTSQALEIQFTPSEIPSGSAFIGFFVIPDDRDSVLNVGDWVTLSCDEDGTIALARQNTSDVRPHSRISFSTPCFELGNFQQNYDDVAIALLKNLHANQIPITLGGAEFLAIYQEQHQAAEEWIDFTAVASFANATPWAEAVKLREKVVYL
jgi:hypothetical protein